jgi:hypothetical protein
MKWPRIRTRVLLIAVTVVVIIAVVASVAPWIPAQSGWGQAARLSNRAGLMLKEALFAVNPGARRAREQMIRSKLAQARAQAMAEAELKKKLADGTASGPQDAGKPQENSNP